MNEEDRTLAAYDAVPYGDRAVSETHPDVLGAFAALHGLEAVAPEGCRVLELGCASGVNVLALAAALPGASFVGVDGSRRQIEEGERVRREAALGNVRLIPTLFDDLPEDIGSFDYVLCHGVFSWVSADTQDRLLALVRRRLAPRGLAFVSFNVYPGWHSRQMLREMLLFHVRDVADPVERVQRARELVEVLARLSKEEKGTYRARFAGMAEDLAKAEDGHFFHEFLEEENRPLYFHDVARRAGAAGLRYVASTSTTWEAFPPREVEEALAGFDDVVAREQYLDFFSDRTFRRSIFCRDDAAFGDTPAEARVRSLFVSGHARPRSPDPDVRSEAVEEFVAGTDSRITTSRPLVKAALTALHRAMPRALSFEELWRETIDRRAGTDPEASEDDLARLLLRGFPAGLLRLSPRPLPCAAIPPERPEATAFARLQAREGPAVATLLHRTAELDDLDRLLLGACDGSRDRVELAGLVAAAVERGDFRLADETGAPVRDLERIATACRQAVDAGLTRLTVLGLFRSGDPMRAARG